MKLRRRLQTRSQIKLFESIAVMLVFVFLVAIGIRFYYAHQERSLKMTANEIITLDAVKTTIVLSNMPEISCSRDGDSDVACIDLYKVTAWSFVMQRKEFQEKYLPLIGLSEITVERLYPTRTVWTIYNTTLINSSLIKNGESKIDVPTILYNPIEKKNQLAILHVKTYQFART